MRGYVIMIGCVIIMMMCYQKVYGDERILRKDVTNMIFGGSP